VFTHAGRPINQVNTKAWKSALKRAGIDNFRWHDSRHTWTSWRVQNGTPVYDLQEIGNWKSVDMVRGGMRIRPRRTRRNMPKW
jgi:integrase